MILDFWSKGLLAISLLSLTSCSKPPFSSNHPNRFFVLPTNNSIPQTTTSRSGSDQLSPVNLYLMEGFHGIETGIIINGIWVQTVQPISNSTGVSAHLYFSAKPTDLSIVLYCFKIPCYYTISIDTSKGSNLYIQRLPEKLVVQQLKTPLELI